MFFFSVFIVRPLCLPSFVVVSFFLFFFVVPYCFPFYFIFLLCVSFKGQTPGTEVTGLTPHKPGGTPVVPFVCQPRLGRICGHVIAHWLGHDRMAGEQQRRVNCFTRNLFHHKHKQNPRLTPFPPPPPTALCHNLCLVALLTSLLQFNLITYATHCNCFRMQNVLQMLLAARKRIRILKKKKNRIEFIILETFSWNWIPF